MRERYFENRPPQGTGRNTGEIKMKLIKEELAQLMRDFAAEDKKVIHVDFAARKRKDLHEVEQQLNIKTEWEVKLLLDLFKGKV